MSSSSSNERATGRATEAGTVRRHFAPLALVALVACSGPEEIATPGASTNLGAGTNLGTSARPAPGEANADPRITDVPLPPDVPAAGARHRKLAFGAMGTEVSIEAIGPSAAALDAALLAAEAELRRVEDVMTSWRDSPLTRINARAGEGPVPIDLELARMVGRGLAVGELTGGAFDVTFASVGKLWDFKAVPPVLPTQAQIDAALAGVGYQRVRLDLEAGTIELPAGTRLGLGGIAKGYGVDRAMAVLLQHGVQHGIVNAGGDMKVLGTQLGQPWRIAIAHPRNRDHVLAMVPLANTCMVTSGDYERFFEHDGKRYHHILDPRTGYPATGAMSATVIAPDAAFADALATALAVLPTDESLALVEGLDRVECLLVDLDGDVFRSSGLGE
ncbi:MAG: FAD:protein FMN transferase [Planctomycetota bacterium]|nr:FAD:protein FMN transferase [Planctomycetota bacterium]